MKKRHRLSALLRSATPAHSPLKDAVDAVVAALDKDAATPSDGERSRSSSSKPPVVIDYAEYPHLVERVIAHSDLDALLLLRSTCRVLCERISGVLFGHVVLEAAYDTSPPSPESEGEDWPPLRGKWVRSSLVRSWSRITMLPNYSIPTELPPSCVAARPRGRGAATPTSVWTNPHLLRLLSHARTVDLLVSKWWLDPHSVLCKLSGARTLRLRWDDVPLNGPDQWHSLVLGPRRQAPVPRARRHHYHARPESVQLDPLDFAHLGPLGRLERVIIAASGAWDWNPTVAVDRSETITGQKCTTAVMSTISECIALEMPASVREVILVLHSTCTPKRPEFPIVLRSTFPARGRASSSSSTSQIDSSSPKQTPPPTPPKHTSPTPPTPPKHLSPTPPTPPKHAAPLTPPKHTAKTEYNRLSTNSLPSTIVTDFDKPALPPTIITTFDTPVPAPAPDSLSPDRAGSFFDQQRASHASSMATLVGENDYRPNSQSLQGSSLERHRPSMNKSNRVSWSGRGTRTKPTRPPMEVLCDDLSPDDAAFVIMWG